jgi:alanine racemase
MQRALLTISRSALSENVAGVRRMIGDRLLIAVVKADAYGHGVDPVAKWLLEDGADRLAVAYLGEALALGGLLPDGCERVLVLGGVPPEHAEAAVASGATLTVGQLSEIPALADAADRVGAISRVHLKVDTGMSRLGLARSRVPEAVSAIAARPSLRLEGAFTHLATAEDPDEAYARQQLARWEAVKTHLPAGTLTHVLASGGAVRFPEYLESAVRTGLLVYGIDPLAGLRPPPLRQAITLAARLEAVREVEPGSGVSYGATWRPTSPARVGVVPVGYADGYPRSLSGVGWVMFRGERAPIRGRVCMDRFMVDLTQWPDARPGETVTLLGEGASVNEVAAAAGTINHEILSRLGSRLVRRYVE